MNRTGCNGAGSGGYKLGGGLSSSSSREKMEAEYSADLDKFKEKERQKYLKKLDEKVKRHGFLRTDVGQKLGTSVSESLCESRESNAHGDIKEIRKSQQKNYEKTLEDSSKVLHTLRIKEEERNKVKLEEKMKKYSHLNLEPQPQQEKDNDTMLKEIRRRQQENYCSKKL